MTATGRPIIDLPARPDIPGLVFRHFGGARDYPGMVAANMAARDAYGILETISVESFAAQYEHLTNSDPGRDILVVELDGEVVGYSRVEWSDQQDGSRAYGFVAVLRPDLRGRGIGSAVLAWNERRLREIAATQPDDGRPRWLQADVWDRDEAGQRLIRAHGYEPVRRAYEMVRPTLDDVPDPDAVALPDGIEVRPVTRADFRRIFEADAEAFRDHWGEIDESEAAFLRFAEDPTYDPGLFSVAFDGDEIAGVVMGVIDPEDAARKGAVVGLIDSVSVRRRWRRRGLARALVLRTLGVLRARGATSAYLGVDAENPNQALTLYTDTGFQVASSGTTWRKPLDGDQR